MKNEIKPHPTSLLLVEGKEDFHVIHALCKKLTISVRNQDIPDGGAFSIEASKGIEKLLAQIGVWFKSSSTMTTIGIVIDADTNLLSRWESAKNTIEKLGFTLPDMPPAEGIIVDHEKRRIGVWVMPDNVSTGMIEDFAALLVPSEDSTWPRVNAFLDALEEDNQNAYPKIHRAKAAIHTWLGIQEEPGSPMGQAITKRYLTTNEETCQRFAAWLRRLFETE